MVNHSEKSLWTKGHRRTGTRIISWPNVFHQTGLSRTTIWRKIRANEFPSPIQISPGRVGWIAEEVNTWVQSQIDAASRAED